MRSARARATLLLLLAVAATFGAFAPALDSPFFLDDFLHLQHSGEISWKALVEGSRLRPGDLDALWWVPRDIEARYFRPLVTLSFALEQRLWGAAAFGYHLMNLLAHCLAAYLVYRVGRRLLGHAYAAGSAALLFLSHPIHAGAVGWIAGRTDVGMAVFYLLALSGYLDLRLDRAAGRARALAVPLALAAALLSKESAISFVALILLLEWLVLRHCPDARPGCAAVRTARIGIAVVTGLYAALVLPSVLASALPSPYRFPTALAAAPGLLLQFVLYALACLFLLPILPFGNLEAWQARPVLLGALATLSLAAAVLARRRASPRPSAAFFAGWFVLTLLPSAGIMMGERFAYLPSAGFCLLLAAVLFARPPAARVGRAALPALLLLYAMVTLSQTAMLHSLSRESLRQTRALVEVGRRAPRPQRIYLVNGWFASCFWVTPATQWLAGGEAPPVTVLTLSPDLLPPSLGERRPAAANWIAWLAPPAAPGSSPQIELQDAASIVVRSAGPPLIGGSILDFFRFGRVFAAGDTIFTPALDALVLAADREGLEAVRFTFPRALADRAAVWLIQDGAQLRLIAVPEVEDGPG